MNHRRPRAFRRDTRFSRSAAALTAATLAAFLVLGSGAAFADDVPTDPPAAATTDAPATDAPATEEPPAPPANDPAPPPPSGDPASSGDPQPPTLPSGGTDEPSTPSAPQSEDPKPTTGGDSPAPSTDEPAPAPTVTKAAAGPSKFTGKTMMAALSDVFAALAVTCTPGSNEVGGFEIDGDTCVESGLDWDTTGVSVEDGFDDSTGFTQGTSENDDPADWVVGNQPNGKTDIGTAWAYSHNSGGTVYGYFGLTNNSTSGGTSQYDLEYSQADPVENGSGLLVPVRTPGDLLFRFSSTGSDPIVFSDAKKYTLVSDDAWDSGDCFEVGDLNAGWCDIPIPPAAFAQQVNADGTFFEGAINISLFYGDGDCTGSFGSVSIRSVTGGSFATSALKDYVTPLGVNTPSNCATIVIDKKDEDGNHLGGATFEVSPNPDPSLSDVEDDTPLTITDNGPGDDNPADGIIVINPVDPGDSYTVTETVAPDGYLLPTDPSVGPIAATEGGTITFPFIDPKAWEPLTATKTAVPSYHASYAWSVVKEIAAAANGPWLADTTENAPLVKKAAVNAVDGGNLYYRVTVTEGAETKSDYQVTGTISVDNDNDEPVVASISDALPGGTCLVEGDATHIVAVPAGGDDYSYVCDLGDSPAPADITGTKTNTANVTWDKSTYPQSQDDLTDDGVNEISATADYAFGAPTSTTDKTVTVHDDKTDALDGLEYTWSAAGTTHTSDVYSTTATTDPGTCTAVIVNTVSVLNGENVLASDQAYGQVCVTYTQISVLKVDSETGEVLPGAEFTLSQGETVLDTATSGDNGVAVFDPKLGPGSYTVTETQAPEGYSLPIGDEATVAVTINADNFVENGVMAPITFRDPANGTLALLAKQHQERDPATNEWVASDGAVEFGDEIRYVIGVEADGPKLQHDVTVTDYVPGSNAADTTSTGTGVYVADSAICTGDFTCTATVDEATGKITWVLNTAGQPAGTVKGDATGTVEFTIRMQDLPDEPTYDDNGEFSVVLWNQAYLDSAQYNPQSQQVEPAAQQKSNEVTDEAKAFEEQPPVDVCPDVAGNQPTGTDCGGEDALPPTGGPDSWLMYLGLALALGGCGLVVSDRRHRRRS